MRSFPFRRAALGSAFAVLAVASCLHIRPPAVRPSTSLAPSAVGSGPRSKGPFAVVFAGPHDTVTDRDEAAVTILFNRPMRTFEASDFVGLPAVRLHADDGPPIAGTWRFIGTHGLLFVPTAPLPGSSRFTVTVPAGTRALDGDALTSDYAFTFTTAPPQVLGTGYKDVGRDLRPDATFAVQWNQKMDPEAVAKKTRLSVRNRPSDAAKIIAVRAAHPKPTKDLTAEAAESIVVLTPAEPLPLDNAVELVVDAGLRGVEGPLVMKAPYTLSLRTYGPLRLADFRCPKVNQGRCQAHRDITVVLSNEVAPDELRAHVKTAGLPRQKTGDANAKAPRSAKASEPRRDHLLGVDPDMGKRYRITLTKGMRDVFGQTLDRDVGFDVDTEAPFLTRDGKVATVDAGAAVVAAPTPHEPTESDGENQSDEQAQASADEAARAQERDPRPKRPMLSYDLTLGVTGHVVEAVGKDGARAHVVPIGAVNIPTYGMLASKMRQEDAVVWLNGTPRTADTAPRWQWVTPGARENVRAVKSVDLDTLLGGPGARGAALLAVGLPGIAGPTATELLTVTDIGVSAAVSPYGSLVWVTRLSTGKPLAGATVSVREGTKGEVFRATTDGQGLTVVPKEQYDPVEHGGVRRDDLLFVSAGDDWTYQRIERAVASEKSPIDVDLLQRGAWAGVLFTDRGVYRPGESVKLAGIFRKVDAAGMNTIEGSEVRIEVRDSEDEHVFEGRAKLDAFGGIALDVPLPRTSHFGDGRISASLGGRGGDGAFTTSILLAAYKASEFKVAVDPAKSEYVRGDEASFDVHAEYLFGAPMGNVRMHTTAERSSAGFVPPGAEGFVVTDEANIVDKVETNPRAEELSASDAELDDKGAAARTLKLDLPRMRGTERVTLEAEITDLTNQTVAKRATVLVHPASFYLGIKRPERRFLAVGADVPAVAVAFDPAGRHVAGVAAKFDLILRTWVGVVEDQVADVARRRSQIKDEVVGTCSVTTTASAASCKIKVRTPGYYLLRATAKDGRGNDAGASTSFYALDDRADETTSAVSFRNPEARGVELEADKTEYKSGENARILVRNPFREAEALVTVQRGGVLWQNVVTLRGPMPVVEVPVRAEYFPNVYVGVHLVRGRIQAPPEGGVDLGAPDFRMGMTEIKVDPNTHRLDVRIASAKKEYRPGEEVDADLIVAGPDGKGARSALTFYAVDEGVLMLTGYKTPDPLPAFATERRLAVFGLENRESLAHILSLKNGQKIARLGFEFLENDDKGGAGGGGGENAIRADFKTTAFFEAGRVTTNEGKAHFHFKLPDNLTTFRLMAVAAASDDKFGFGESRITTSRKLMARPAMPRLVRVGDELEAGVVVSSKDLADTAVDVSLKAKGVAALGAVTRRIQLARGKSMEVRFPVKATESGEATFEFDVRGADQTDRVLVKRDVELPTSRETVAVYGETRDAAGVALGDLRGIRTDTGGLDVHLSSTALVGIGESFDRNLEYPYGCTEQLTSRTLPLLLLSDLAEAFHARLPAKVDDVIDDAVGEILKHQHGSGGFGYWEDDSVDVPWLSAYAVLALETAAQKQHFVPKESRDRGIDYLRGVIARARFGSASTPEDEEATPSPDDGTAAPAGEKDPAVDYAAAAFAADVLATVGQAPPGTLNQLFDARRGKPLFSQALLLHAMVAARMPPAELDVLVHEIESKLRVGANEAFADESSGAFDEFLDSPVRTTALVLRALLAANPKHPLASRLARGLLSHRERGAWRSTQENTWALLALDDYRKKQESIAPNFDAKGFLGEDLFASAGFHGTSTFDALFSVSAARVAKNPGPLTLSVTGQGTLFYAAELRYASPALPPRPDDAGFSVEKLLRAVKPRDLAEAEKTVPRATEVKATANDLVMVDVLFETAEPREQIVIDDPLPAGLEPVDFALETSAQHERVSEGPLPPVGRGRKAVAALDYGAFRYAPNMHREMHDDRILTFLPHVDPGIYHFRYLARATTPGQFVVPPLRAECMYAPEVNGRTGASTFEVVAETTASSAVARVGK